MPSVSGKTNPNHHAKTIDLRGLVRPQLAEATKREDNPSSPSSASSRWSGVGHARYACAACCCPARGSACGVPSTASCTSTRPSPVSPKTSTDHRQPQDLTLPPDDVEEAVLRISRAGGNVTAADINASNGVHGDTASTTSSRSRTTATSTSTLREQGRATSRPICTRSTARCQWTSSARLDLQPGPPRNFTVAEARVGQRTDYDRLSHGRDERHDLAGRSGELRGRAAQTHFQYFADWVARLGADRWDGRGCRRRRRLGGLLRTPIDDLELSVRSVNSLKNSNIRTLGDLVRQTESQILQVKNFGKKSLQEIADLLERENLNFGMRFEENGDGSVRVLDFGTPPSRAAAAAPDDMEE